MSAHFGPRRRRVPRSTKVIVACALLLASSALPVPVLDGWLPLPSLNAASGQIDGRVFDDVNSNGADDTEPGMAGVVVQAWTSDGSLAASATTIADGSYALSGLNDAATYRVEFSGLPAGYESGPIGADNGSSVVFVAPDTSDVDFGVLEPTVCQTPPSNALLHTYAAAVTCSAVVDPAFPKDSFGLLDIDNSIPASGVSDTTADTPMFHHVDWHIDQLGNVFGVAIDNRRGDLFTAASSNWSHEFYTNTGGTRPSIVQYGLIGGGANDLGAAGTVYRLDAVTGAPSVFAQLPQQSTTFTHVECEQEGTTDRTSGVGLGNVLYDEVNDQLFVSSWEDGYIYRLDMAGTILDAYDPGATDDGTAGMANGIVPFGLELSADSSRLFFGTVFSQEIWSVDLNDGAFTGGSSVIGGTTVHENAPSEQSNVTLTATGGEPAPTWLNDEPHFYVSDLELLPNGEMLAGMRVGCNDSPHSAYNHRGQTHRVSADGSGFFVNDLGALDVSATGDAGLDDNYGGVGYYNHPDGSVDYAVTSADIVNEAGPHGLAVFNGEDATGSPIAPVGAIDYGTTNDPKGIAGDVEILNLAICTPSDIQVGDYVWFDVDGDGIQDPDEPALADVTVRLLSADGNTVIATTTTDAGGQYSFGTANGLDTLSNYLIEFDVTTNTTALPAGITNADLIETLADAGEGASADPDASDSDVVANRIAITTGGPGENNHTYDAGYTLPYDLSLTKSFTSDTFGSAGDAVVENGADATFTITVTNQGMVDAATFTVTDHLPAGFVLNDGAWGDNADGTASRTAGPLAAGDSVDLTITLTADSATDGAHVNWAEISADDGNDVDSSPNLDVGDDNQPAGPGAPTDDVIDNSVDGAGDPDEDDHDPAGITVQTYDLALTKVYTSDTSGDGNATDGVMELGDDVTFTITVTNQGTQPMTTATVTDHLPAGFVLNDGAWGDNADGTASRDVGPLASGASEDITITMTAANSGAGDLVNWAEISADDGNDVDSSPNLDVGDDNQPAAPGDPTDDVTDNSVDAAGDPDEDDHDPAGITVDAYDLALTKVYTSDTFASPTDGVVQNGADVTFTITVTNQGTLDATSFTVTDHLPAGFVLNDGAWGDNADGTASRTAGPLAAGDSVDLNITMTASGAADGEYVNWAEISADDGNDVDSSPNLDVGDDNQPAGPGAPTDDVIDNSVDVAGDPDEDDHDPAPVTVASYDLALTKVYTSDTSGAPTDGVIDDGADVTFTITVTNQGTIDATTFTVTDHLPAGFVLNDGAWGDNADGTASRTAGPLLAGDSVDLPITMTAAAAASGDHVNWAEVSADDGDDIDSAPNLDVGDDNQPAGPGAPTDDVIDNSVDAAGDPDEDDHDPAGVTLSNYDLALTKVYTSDTFGSATDGVVQTGSDVTFTITVTNQGDIDATTFTVTDHLPAGFVLNDGAWGDNADGTASRTAGPLLAGDSVDLTITLTADGAADGAHVNWAEISADDGDDRDSTPNLNVGDDNQPVAPGDPTDDVIDNSVDGTGDPDEDDHDPAGITVVSYDLALAKVYTSDTYGLPADELVQPGFDVTFTITVTNQGSFDASTFTVTDHLPAGFVLNDGAWGDNADGTASRTAGPLLAGESIDLPITLTVDPATAVAGDLVNWAEISADDGDDVDSSPNLDVGDDNQPAAPGDPTDDVIDNSVDAAGDPDEDDHDPAGISVQIYDLALTKTYTSDTFANPTDGAIATGADVTFTITVTNQGSLDATTFTVTDHLPAGFVLNDGAWGDNADGTASRTAGPLLAGDSMDLTITMTATTAPAGDHVNWAEISADDGDDADSTPNLDVGDDNQPAAPGDPTDDVTDNSVDGAGDPDEDDHDPAGVTLSNYDLALTKVLASETFGDPNDGVVQNGADATFTITVTNQGTATANTFTVTDHLPAGFVLNDGDWGDNADGTASRTAGPLAPGESIDVPITLTADSAADGAHVNWAEISADDGDDVDSSPNLDVGDDNQPAGPGAPTDDVIDNSVDAAGDPDEDDHDPAGLTVVSYDLALTKVYTSDTFGAPTDGIVQEGFTTRFTITVTNQGSLRADSFTVTDHIPAGFVLSDFGWTSITPSTARRTLGPLDPGESVDVTIDLFALAGTPVGEHVNWAEISADDGDDVDSSPNLNVGDDNQPAGPGDPTDDVTDNSVDAAGDPDEDDHDPAGVEIGVFDLALTKAYTSDTFGATTDGVIATGSDVTFTITVTNQGTLNATTFTVMDHLPAGFVLNDGAWSDNGDGTASRTAGPLLAGDSTDLTITLTAATAGGGDHVNWAEISDDGIATDIDSTPNISVTDDNQPTGPGAPTDDVTDNSVDAAGDPDEDDHDPAGVRVSNYDLALVKTYLSDDFETTNDGVIQNGSDVTFRITVINQGDTDATNATITDHIPAGFSLNDGAWNDNGDGTAWIDVGPIAVGRTAVADITLTADNAVDGLAANWAEISADDGDDIDSSPNLNVGDDNQPTGPGAPTDDATDNSVDGAGDPDEDDHDPAGVTVVSYDLALTKAYTSDTFDLPTDGLVQPGFDVTFTITVENQGTKDANVFQITDHLPAGFELNDGAWTDNGDGTAWIQPAPLSAGSSIDVPITLRVVAPAVGEHVNWAEISVDDGDDVDSSPNLNVGDDNQPAGPGDPTDDVTDNSVDAAGDPDEDDHDPAGVEVQVYDLALTKTYTSDDFVNPTDGIIATGSDVTFTITVFNQGSVDAGSVTVTDHLPAGFVLNDGAWNDNLNGTASRTIGALAAGDSVDLTITLTAATAGAGNHVNWAEISADDGEDHDSLTNIDVTDDAQPAFPGDTTDDVTDNRINSDGEPDEDDHDPAGVQIENYDLALTKVYTSDTFGDPNDAVIEDGDDATFTITVFNQGTEDASSFEVTDRIPTGFVLNDGNWTDNGDGTASRSGGPLVAGDSVDLTITMTAVGVPDGTHVNVAEITSDDGDDVDSTPDDDDDTQDDQDDAELAVASYDLALAKVYTSDTYGDAGDAIVEPGANVTWTITVTNEGTLDAASFDVTDRLPAGFELNDPTWTDNGDGTATRTAGPLLAGDSLDLTIVTRVDTTNPGTFVNVAEITSDDGDDVDSTPDDDDDTQDDQDDDQVTVEVYDLALTKFLVSDTHGNPTDGVMQPGSDVTFGMSILNQGTVDATTITVTDHLPAGFVLNDGAWDDNLDDTASLVTGPVLAGRAIELRITLTYVGTASGDFVNWAEISADDGNDIDSGPDLLVGNDNQPAGPGASTDGEVDNSPDPAGDPDEDDHDPAGVTVEVHDLALTKRYVSDTFGLPDDGVVQNGSQVTFEIEVTNQGTVDAGTFTVTDHIPAGFVLDDGAWDDNLDGTASIDMASLAAGETVAQTITLRADAAVDGAAVNLAEISADSGIDIDSTPNSDPTDDNQPSAPGEPTDDVTDNSVDAAGDPDEDDHDPAGITVASHDLALTKAYTSDTHGAVDDGIVEPGDDVVFTITITNQGTLEASTFTVTDHLPAGFVLNDGAWTDNNDGTASIDLGGLAAGDSMDQTITLTVQDRPAGDAVNWAEISADAGDDVDSTPNLDVGDDNQPTGPGEPTDGVIDNSVDGTGDPDEDDHDPAGVRVERFDLALEKVYTSDTSVDGQSSDAVIEPGDDVLWTITVTNEGSVDATNIEVIDHLPAGFVLNDADWTDNGDDTATRTIGALSAGDAIDLTITMTAVDPGAGELVNVAEISSDDGDDADSTPDDDPDDDEDDIDDAVVTVNAYDLALTKAYVSDSFGDSGDGVVLEGETVTYSITVTNQGTVPSAVVQITDHIPAGFELADADWTDNSNGTASIDVGPTAPGASTTVGITLRVADAAIGDHVNWAEISVDDGNDIDSTTDDDPDNDGPVTDDEIDNGNGDEDDHDPATVTVVPVFDLALRKQLADPSAVVRAGDLVTFTITVFNQGAASARDIALIDYVPSGLTLADSDWTPLPNGDATIVLDDAELDPGEETSVNITLRVTDGANGSLENFAEITDAEAIDVLGTAIILPGGVALPDIDSVPDATDDEDPVDDEVSNAGDDEDDHDVAILAVAETADPPPAPLALTGREAGGLVGFALVLLVAGAVAVTAARRDNEDTVYYY